MATNHSSYKLCSEHFKVNMYTNSLCNRLKQNAIPTVFSSLEGSSKCPLTDQTYSRYEPLHIEVPWPKKICILSDILIVPPKLNPMLMPPRMDEQSSSIVFTMEEQSNLFLSPTAPATSSTLKVQPNISPMQTPEKMSPSIPKRRAGCHSILQGKWNIGNKSSRCKQKTNL